MVYQMKKGMIFDIQRFSIHDGPGLRTIVFLKGCLLHCLWCCNPEGINHTPELIFYPRRCYGCGECIQICPQRAITIVSGENKVNIRREKCDNCGACVSVCNSRALILKGKEMTVEEILKEVEKDMIFYQISGGGLTLSGGEPMEQVDFAKELLSAAKKVGINTAVETCGYVNPDSFVEVLRNVDYLLYDIKHIDPQRHKKFTGKDNKIILENLKLAAKICPSVTVRIPFIPGFNDSRKEIFQIVEFISSIPIVSVHLLPYHNFGSSKYESLGKEYKMMSVKSVEKKKIERIKSLIEEKYPVKIQIGG